MTSTRINIQVTNNSPKDVLLSSRLCLSRDGQNKWSRRSPNPVTIVYQSYYLQTTYLHVDE